MSVQLTTPPWQSLVWAMLEADERRSETILRGVSEFGLNRRELCSAVITPAMHEVGRLWALKEISVMEEHVASAIAWAASSHRPNSGLVALAELRRPDLGQAAVR